MLFTEEVAWWTTVLTGASVAACFAVIFDYGKSHRHEQYPCGFVCWIALGSAGVNLASLWFWCHWWVYGYDRKRDALFSNRIYCSICYSFGVEVFWTVAWSIEMCKKIRNPLSRSRAFLWHFFIWPCAGIYPLIWWFTGHAPSRFPRASYWIRYRVSDSTWNVYFRFNNYILFLGCGACLVKLLIAFDVARKAYRLRTRSRLQQNHNLWMFFIYCAVYCTTFFTGLILNLVEIGADTKSVSWSSMAIYSCAVEGLLLSSCRLFEVHRARRLRRRLHRASLFIRDNLHSGTPELDACSAGGAASLAASSNRTTSASCRSSCQTSIDGSFPLPPEMTTGLSMAMHFAKTDLGDLVAAILQYMRANGSNTNEFYESICPSEFEELRDLWDFDLPSCVRDVKNSLVAKPLKRAAGGKSGALFHICEKHGLVIKVEASDSAARQVGCIAAAYTTHMREYVATESLLCRIYGALVAKTESGEDMSVLLMECVVGDSQYDVKGKRIRCLSSSDEFHLRRKIQSDETFASAILRVLQGHDSPSRFVPSRLQSLDSALRVLSDAQRTDYSLLIKCDASGAVRVRIIDYLQEYDFKKQSERAAKKWLSWCRENAILPPAEYADRLHSFLVTELRHHFTVDGMGMRYAMRLTETELPSSLETELPSKEVHL